LLSEGNLNFEGQLHHGLIWRGDVFCRKLFFKPSTFFAQRRDSQLWWSIRPWVDLKRGCVLDKSIFQAVNFVCLAKGISTLKVNYTMGWFKDGMCFIEN
jgi:hypothetical protein